MLISARSCGLAKIVVRSMSSSLSTATKAVLITREIDASTADVEAAGYDIRRWTGRGPIPRKELISMGKGVTGLLCMLTDKIDAEVLDKIGPQLKVVSTMSVGFDHVDLAACAARNVVVGNTPGVLTDATADLTVGLLLATTRRFAESASAAKDGSWGAWEPSWLLGPSLTGKTVGIVGFGRIGAAVAKRLRAFSVGPILYSGRSAHPDLAAPVNAEFVPLETLLQQSDFVICTASLTPETKEMFNKQRFAQMKRTAVFINTSRGGLVQQDALVDALKTGVIRSAGLDVCTPEPLDPKHPLLSLSNCLLLPHIGSATEEARRAMAEIAMKNLLAGIEGKPLTAEVKQ